MRKRKKAAFGIVLLIISIIVLCAALEILARVSFSAFTRKSEFLTYSKKYKPIKRYSLRVESHLSGDDRYYKGVPNLNYEFEGNTITYNSKGFRSPEFEDQKKKFRIFCFGGSSTWGAGNDDEGSWPFLLQKYFDRHYSNQVEVINAGFGSYNSKLILNLLKNEVINYDPDMIVIYSGYNDHAGAQTNVFANTSRFRVWLNNVNRFLVNKSVFFFVINKLATKGNTSDTGGIARKITKQYRKNISEVIDLAKEHDIEVVMVKQPLYVKSKSPSSAVPGAYYEKIYGNPYFEEETFQKIHDDVTQGEFKSKAGRTYYYQYHIYNVIDELMAKNDQIYMIDIVNDIIVAQENRGDIFNDVVHLSDKANNYLAGLIFEDQNFQKALEALKQSATEY